jgi:MFS family permease
MVGSAIGSMAFPLLLAHVSANAREGDRVRAFSIIVTIGPSIALLIAPLLSSGLIQIFGLRAPFLLSAFFTLVSVGFLSRISASAAENMDDELNESQPARGYRAVIRNVAVRNLLLLKLITIFALGVGTQLVPNYLRDVGNYTDARISLFSAFSAIGTIAFGALVVRNRRFNDTPLLGAALAVFLVSVGYVLFLTPEVIALVVVAFLFRGGMFASISLFSAVLGELAPARDREHIFTMSELAIVGGFSTAPLVAGLLYGFDPALPLIVSAIAGIPVIAVLLRLSYVRRQDDSGPPDAPVSVVVADLDSLSVESEPPSTRDATS